MCVLGQLVYILQTSVENTGVFVAHQGLSCCCDCVVGPGHFVIEDVHSRAGDWGGGGRDHTIALNLQAAYTASPHLCLSIRDILIQKTEIRQPACAYCLTRCKPFQDIIVGWYFSIFAGPNAYAEFQTSWGREHSSHCVAAIYLHRLGV